MKRRRWLEAMGAWLAAPAAAAEPARVAVLISANAEWRVVRPLFAAAEVERSPYGEFFYATVAGERVLFFHGGWGKISAAATTQYVIDHFRPSRLINLGTCGGVEGRIQRFDIVAVERVVVYDIFEAMGDSKEAVDFYSTLLAVPSKPPVPVVKATLYSGDRDLTPAGLRELEAKYHPVAADWESGAIAWVAARNRVPVLILRGVTDLVSLKKGEAEGNLSLFEQNTVGVMKSLVGDLGKWLPVWR